jgi:hypothetical protein
MCKHFRVPPFAKNAMDRAPILFGDASEIKSLGHPPPSLVNIAASHVLR